MVGYIFEGEIFVDFTNQVQFVKILPSKYFFSWYFKQSVTIYENLPLKSWESSICQIFPLENNPLYGNSYYALEHCSKSHPLWVMLDNMLNLLEVLYTLACMLVTEFSIRMYYWCYSDACFPGMHVSPHISLGMCVSHQ